MKYVVLGSIVLIGIGVIFFLATWAENSGSPETNSTENLQACVDLGCPMGTQFVGSTLTNIYFQCTCIQAREIKQENIVCFEQRREAIMDDFYRGSC